MSDLNVKKIRTIIGLSQKSFASLFNISRGAVAKWESGKTKPKLGHALKIREIEERYFNGEKDIAYILLKESKTIDKKEDKKSLIPLDLDEKLNLIISTLEQLNKKITANYSLIEKVENNEKIILQTNKNFLEFNLNIQSVLKEITAESKLKKLS